MRCSLGFFKLSATTYQSVDGPQARHQPLQLLGLPVFQQRKRELGIPDHRVVRCIAGIGLVGDS